MSDRVAIMNGSVIEQCGTPEDVYENPTSVFAAGFIGTGDLMPGVYAGGSVCPLTADLRIPVPAGPRLERRRPGQRRDPAGEDLDERLHPGDGAGARHHRLDELSRRHHAVPRLRRDRLTLTVLEQNLRGCVRTTVGTPAAGSDGLAARARVVLRELRDSRRRRRGRRRAGRAQRRARPGGRRRLVTVLEARDRVGGRVEQVELARRTPGTARRRGRRQRAHVVPRARRGARPDARPVVRRGAGEITRQVPGAVYVGPGRRGSPTPTSPRTRSSRRRSRSWPPRSTRPTRSPLRPAPARPAQRRRLLREAGATPAVLRAMDLVHLSLADGSIERQSMFAYARKQAVGGGTGSYDVDRVGEPAGRRGIGHGGADDGRRLPDVRLSTPVPDRRLRHGCTVTTASGEEIGPTPSCLPCPPAPPATSTSPASATIG